MRENGQLRPNFVAPSSPNSRSSRVRGGGGTINTNKKQSSSNHFGHNTNSTIRQQQQRSSSSVLSTPAARCLFLQKYILFLLFPSLLTLWTLSTIDFDQFADKQSSLLQDDPTFLPPPVVNNNNITSTHARLVARQRIIPTDSISRNSEKALVVAGDGDGGHVVWEDAFYRRWRKEDSRRQKATNSDGNDKDEWYARRIQNATAVIAYATTITGGCEESNRKGGKSFIDLAAVLAHSIHLSSIRNPNSTSTFDYKLYAFLHPDATAQQKTTTTDDGTTTTHTTSWCAGQMRALGYIVQIRETPINVANIARPSYRDRLTNPNSGCCGEKEFLKLYSYTLTQHPIVVHVDLDTMILRPLDEFYHAMLAPENTERYIPHAQWPEDRHLDATNDDNKRVTAMFTRDYPMLPIYDTTTRTPEKVGVQGGFLMIRPNTTIFDELCQMILRGHFESGWYEEDPGDGKKKLVKYPGFYGAAQVQGLLAFYYGHVRPNQTVELNRCRVNNMVDNPRHSKNEDKKSVCITGQADEECQDCRLMNASDIYTAHFTFCSKPSFCGMAMNSRQPLCYALHSKWHEIRYDLETVLTGTAAPLDHLKPMHRDFFGHCEHHGMYTTVDWLNLTTTMKKQRSPLASGVGGKS